jgi:hypothetical protein
LPRDLQLKYISVASIRLANSFSLLAINGSSVRTVEYVAGCFHLDHTQDLDSLTLLLVNINIGENGKDSYDTVLIDSVEGLEDYDNIR